MDDIYLVICRRSSKVACLSNSQTSNLLPNLLYYVLKTFGLKISDEDQTDKERSCVSAITSSTKFRICISLTPVLLSLVEGAFSFQHITFIIADAIDHCCYLVAFVLFLYRRQQIIFCMKSLQEMPRKSIQGRHIETTSVLTAIVLVYSCIYMVCGLCIELTQNIDDLSTDSSREKASIVLILINTVLFCVFVYVGISSQIIVFVHISRLAYERLACISKKLDSILEESTVKVDSIQQQRMKFCRLQKLLSLSDSIFNEVMFLWLVRITIRCCLSSINIFTRSWTDGEGSDQVIVIFDTISDIGLLLVLSYFSGRVMQAKMDIQDSLIYLRGNYIPENEDLRSEFQLLTSLIGNSDISFTAAKIFPINRGTALTILGALGSYSVLIYQLSLK